MKHKFLCTHSTGPLYKLGQLYMFHHTNPRFCLGKDDSRYSFEYYRPKGWFNTFELESPGVLQNSAFKWGKYPMKIRNDLIHADRGETVYYWKCCSSSLNYIYTVDSAGNGYSRHHIAHFCSKIPLWMRIIHHIKVLNSRCRGVIYRRKYRKQMSKG